MTNAYAEFEGGRCLLNVEGHATGNPEVCAAVSSLVYALAGYITNASKDGNAEIYTMQLDSGNAVIHFHGDDMVCAAFELVIVGLMQLAKQHPEQVKMTFPQE